MRRLPTFSRPVTATRRRIKIQQTDILEICGMEVDAEILAVVFATDTRALWAFVDDGKGRIQPTPFTEDQVIWLLPADVERAAKDDPQYVGPADGKRVKRLMKGRKA